MRKFLLLVLALFITTGIVSAATKKATLRVGSAIDYAPFEFRDAKGKETGFDIDLISEIGKRMGYNVEFVDMKFTGLIPSLQAETIDVIASTVTITDERKKVVDFTEPYYKSGITISVKNGSTIKTPADLVGKKIGVQMGTTSDTFATAVKDADVTRFEDTSAAFMSLSAGKVDAVVADAPINAYYIKISKDKNMQVVGDVLDAEFYGFVVNKKNPELKGKINETLAKMRKDGGYNKIYKKWFGNTKQ
ncbi:MAG: basic amino acid ABC transporter substrate-binding protein [Rickettsiales bacterium]|nr:MAG: basic amino acid ABC transporter substrate-binding protein [Rickettsiales bacterium]